MSTVGDRLIRFILALMPAAIIALGCGASFLPRELVVRAISAMTAWLLLSFLIGVVVGHCALGEAENT
ncbi:MAG TPA: hypothetical protein VGI78_16120 [Acetobacteraceae bacterium]